ncbi:protein NO VEIN domain-containing protein [Blastococcus aggregatus]|uniref:protein NO VEIN domain-containing protein n=1 Tax=Blastococcus aggregatus TaxID=38502 RepID=UPI00159644E5|nr:DUF3883 domain-containing protein [Blastococcus aggregatus]
MIESYGKLVTGGLYRPQDLQAGHQLLVRSRLVSEEGGRHIPSESLKRLRDLPDDVAAELLLHELLLREPPLWLYAAVVDDEVRWENVPDADQDALRQLLADAARREALLLTLGRTLDAALLAEYGKAGEEHVVWACRRYLRDDQQRPDLAAQVHQVSLRSDQLGYDVTSPDVTGHRHRMEIKTTGSAAGGLVEFFLSRNEATVGERDPSWCLVAVRREADMSLHIVGWCRGVTLLPLLPRDLSPQGRWTSVRLSVPTTDFTPGLPLDVWV